MNDLLSILNKLLTSGDGLAGVIQALGGRGFGAASADGLSRMMNEQSANASRAYWRGLDQDTINQSIERILNRIGVNPYTDIGQGATAMLGGMYHISPDIMGALIGVPNSRKFFGTVANGAYGISQASGAGTPDMFNPYSIMEAHSKTSELAKMAYGFGIKDTGGYDIEYSHGLNADEMGKVTQRLLTSRAAYMDDDGKRLDTESDAFRDRMKKLGAKMNEAVSMMSKLTGSVEEALNVMDGMSGGNLLGGTVSQASEIANKAKRMSAAVRITAAMSGEDPKTIYSRMSGMQLNMAAAFRIPPHLAKASGFSEAMGDMAYSGAMAYSMWSAMNPDASQAQKSRAFLGSSHRATAYAGSSGAAMAAALAYHRDRFSDKELEWAERMYAEGNPNPVMEMAVERLGSSTVQRFLNDRAVRASARMSVNDSKEGRELLGRLDRAGMAGNSAQAEFEGSRKMLRTRLSDIDSAMSSIRSESYWLDRKTAGMDALKKLAMQGEGGLSESEAKGIDEAGLRSFLGKRGYDEAYIERTYNSAVIEKAESQIMSNALTKDEEKRVAKNISGQLQRFNLSPAMRKELEESLERGDEGAVDKALSEIRPRMSSKDFTEFREEMFGGRKMTRKEARGWMRSLAGLKDVQRTGYNDSERLDALEAAVKVSNVTDAGSIHRIVAGDDFRRIGMDRVVRSVFGDSVGDIRGMDMERFVSGFSDDMLKEVEGGKSVSDSFIEVARREIKDEEAAKRRFGDRGVSAIKSLIKQAETPNGPLSEKLSDDSFKSVGSDVVSKKNILTDEINRLRDAGLVDLGKEDRSLTGTFRGAMRGVVKSVFGESVGDVKDEGMKKFVETFSDDMLKEVNGGRSVSSAFAEVARREIKDEGAAKKKFGDKGVETIKSFIERAEDPNGLGASELSNEALWSRVASSVDSKYKDNRLRAIDTLRSAVAGRGEYAKLDDKSRTDKILESFKIIGGMGAGEKGEAEAAAVETAGIDSVIAKAMGESGVKIDDKTKGEILDLARSRIADNGGDYKKSLMSAMKDVGEKSGNKGDSKSIEVLRDKISKMDNVGGIVRSGMLGAVQKNGRRSNGFLAGIAAGDASGAVSNMAGSGIDMGAGFTNPGDRRLDAMASLLSRMDDAARKADDRMANFWNVGSANYAKEAVSETEGKISDLSKRLKDSGITIDYVKSAYKGGDAKKLEGLGAEDKNLLKTLSVTKVAGGSAIDMLDSGKMKEAKKHGDYSKDMLSVTRDRVSRGSSEYGTMKSLAAILPSIAAFFQNPLESLKGRPIPVTVDNTVKTDVNAN